MYAIVRAGAKQQKVAVGDVIEIDKDTLCPVLEQHPALCASFGISAEVVDPRTTWPLDEKTIVDLKARIAKTVAYLRSLPAAAFEGAEDRDCTIPIPNDPKLVIAMNGLQFLRCWALPHFYFHVVTAYDILRHNGVVIGKQDYLSQVGAFVRPR